MSTRCAIRTVVVMADLLPEATAGKPGMSSVVHVRPEEMTGL
jgi:hypothetical protein